MNKKHENQEISSEIICGKNAITEFISDGGTINRLLISNSIHRDNKITAIIEHCQNYRIPFNFVPREKLDTSVASSTIHQGILAYKAPFNYWELSDFMGTLKEKLPLILILDGIEDPHNLGAIIRSAVAANAQGVIIPKHRSAVVNETVIRTSAGNAHKIPIIRVTNIPQSIDTLKANRFWIYGADHRAKMTYSEPKYDTPVALVLGNEGKGVSRLVRDRCDELIQIPMPGQAESLNVSASAALLMFKIIERRLS